ncbi:MAG: phosphonate metabolism protein/1,5-bisphosphokinase (PRPP-forming) PhnN, partial [Paraburkholderia sp.]|nr:phosphonate metabolism protein/1,5-bisphosphokinase (PRPP-forming) PhnN [Paraburkholderia sp.]
MKGGLIYVMGPSGAGKDTLLRYARGRLARESVVFAHRYITREDSGGGGGENHIALTEAEFETRSQRGLFALQWRSHALRYGVGVEIDQWMALGCTVVVNGSRAYAGEA